MGLDFTRPLDGPRRYTVHGSPIGELLLVGDGQSITGVYMFPDQLYAPSIGDDWRPDPGPFGELTRQFDAYFAGDLKEFDARLAPKGTPFQLSVWRELALVPYGGTTTYRDLAQAIGRPTASRAVGMANGRNPVSIILPCHRVLGSDGSLTGYGGGLPRKRRLLELEGAC